MKNNQDSLKDIFENKLNVLTISEKLISSTEEDVIEFSNRTNFDSVLITSKEHQFKVFDKCKEPQISELKHSDVISDSTPLLLAFELIVNKKRVFIKSNNLIDKIATVSDLNKIPFRIWMYGIISILELKLKHSIVTILKEDWKSKLSANRIRIARIRNFSRNKRVSDRQLIPFIIN